MDTNRSPQRKRGAIWLGQPLNTPIRSRQKGPGRRMQPVPPAPARRLFSHGSPSSTSPVILDLAGKLYSLGFQRRDNVGLSHPQPPNQEPMPIERPPMTTQPKPTSNVRSLLESRSGVASQNTK